MHDDHRQFVQPNRRSVKFVEIVVALLHVRAQPFRQLEAYERPLDQNVMPPRAITLRPGIG
jgi:hypothetical protein